MQRTRRGLKVTAAVLLALALAYLAVAVPAFVFPAATAPQDIERADVVFVIGPPADARIDTALDLIHVGKADALMVSLDPEAEAYEKAQSACAEGVEGVKVLCARPEPFTTQGEARWLRTESEARGWDSAAVITFTPHLTRARAITEQCFGGELAMVDSEQELEPYYWAYMFAYQSGAFVKMWLKGGCGDGSGLADAGVTEIAR